jgi:citrate lyase subunit beta-like protein
MRVRRTILYVPGDDRHKIEKAAGLNVDCICLDLEDGVAVNCKQAARQEVLTCLQTIDFGKSERLVRINSISSGLCKTDIHAIIPGKPDGIFLPKVSDARQIQWINNEIEELEKRAGMTAGKLALLVGIESALSILNLGEICKASSRLSALVFGAEDYMADVGGMRTITASELLFARSAVVTHAAAFNLQAIDMVCTEYKNEERLLEETKSGVCMGFSGKQVIHPDQVAPVQQAFTPDPDALEKAARIIQAYQEHLVQGKGAFDVDGKMVDMPVVKAAERLLARAAALEDQP